MGEKVVGTIKWYDVKKRYGFVKTEDDEEVFIHGSGISEGRTYKGFNNNDKVEFELGERDGKPLATNVKLIKKEKENKSK